MEINSLTDIDYLLPPMSETTETDFRWSMETIWLDVMALSVEAQRCMKKGEYEKGADAITKMIELVKANPKLREDYFFGPDMTELHGQRAHFYILARNFNAAAADLEWIEHNASLSTEYDAKFVRGWVELFQGKDSKALRECADRGNLMALLLLNDPENENAPKTEWSFLPLDERIQKLLANRHYAQVIEEIDNGHRYDSEYYAIKGVCYALRGNMLQAIQHLDRAQDSSAWYFSDCKNELALVYIMAGQKDRALHVIKKEERFEHNPITELLRMWTEK